MIDYPIYLHFLDRELRESVNCKITDFYAVELLMMSLFMTNMPIYAALSNIWESKNDLPKTFNYIWKLDNLKLINLFTNHKSAEDFFNSRKSLYSHDKKRYPMYFYGKENKWSENTITLPDSTTEILRADFLKSDFYFISNMISKKKSDYVINEIREKVNKDRKTAITVHMFDGKFDQKISNKVEMSQIETALRFYVSERYTKRYLNASNGTIITGIPYISGYDYLAKNLYYTDIRIFKSIFNSFGLKYNDTDYFDRCIQLRDERKYVLVLQLLRKLSAGLQYMEIAEGAKDNIATSIMFLNNCTKQIRSPQVNIDNLISYLFDIYKICGKIKKSFKEGFDLGMEKEKSILVVVATMTELKQAISEFSTMYSVIEMVDEDFAYFILSSIDTTIYLVKCQMGSTGSGSSIITIDRAIKKFKPSQVYLCGISFGAKKGEQSVGDILIATQIWNYEPEKVRDEETIPRGDKSSTSAYLRQILEITDAKAWKFSKVHYGVLASGEKLINSKDFLEKLISKEPEIIGGDMESAGLMSVAEREKVEFIVVKAISDWGYDKTDCDQEKAAAYSLRYICYTFKYVMNI